MLTSTPHLRTKKVVLVDRCCELMVFSSFTCVIGNVDDMSMGA